MRTIYLLLLTSIILIACDKKDYSDELSAADLSTSLKMSAELNLMKQSLDNIIASPGLPEKRHWDSLYHKHDSLFWQYHDMYPHNHYAHDDHYHNWTIYDPNVNHQGHFHHPFPGHLNDSLVTTQNNHLHDNHSRHFRGHDLLHHQFMDSLHLVHQVHHP